jgi:hypothetical protein
MHNELNDLRELFKQLEVEKDSAIYDAEYAEKRSEGLEIALDLEKVKHTRSDSFNTDSTSSGTATDDKASTFVLFHFLDSVGKCMHCIL